jgi:DNA-binding GntR family transcriptional regulator
MDNTALQPLTPRQLKDQAYAAIKDAITSLRFEPGASIVEGQLAQSLGISKTPIRMALIRLEHEGFVETRRASGTFVRRMSFDDVREIFQVRLALEQCAISQLVAGIEPAQVTALEENVARARGLMRNQQDAEAFAAFNEFHLVLVDLARNQWLCQTYRTLFDHIVRIGNACGRIPGLNQRSLSEHEAVAAALRARDRSGALAAISDHLDSVLADYERNAQGNQLLEVP